MRKLLTQKLALAFIPLALLELATRCWFASNWYQPPSTDARPKLLFVGSSRIGAAVDPAVVQQALGEKRAVYNLGRGGASPVLHYLGLRAWVERDPEILKNAQVVLETFEGVPNPQTWQARWVMDCPEYLPPLMRLSDLPGFWRSGSELNEKVALSSEMLFRSELQLTQWQQKIDFTGDQATNKAFLALRSHLYPGRPVQGYGAIREVAGIRTDDVGVRHFRDFYETRRTQFLNEAERQVPFEDWDSIAWHDITTLVQAHGGTPVFVEIPLGSIPAIPYRSPAGRRERQSFAQAVQRWGTEVLPVAFTTSDADFPDYSHLRKERTEEFSRAIASSLETWNARLAARTARPRN